MPHVAIEITELSKRYQLGTIGTGTLSRDLNMWLAKMRNRPNPYAPLDREGSGSFERHDFWALKDINLEIAEGSATGIIGRNGAGKSTLLKILSRITSPTTGEIRIRGRVSSLLEVGTGFHPELTGRENIFLNGAILGMRRSEIRGKLEEIIDFSGIEQHIDTPVKRYSSGMYVRLAFAVAAHLEPEILVIDEVLAVGDAAFQKKCLGKMNQVTRQGKTLLFVSHNMAAVRNFCTKSVLLHQGRIVYAGATDAAIRRYTDMNFGLGKGEMVWTEQDAPGSEYAKIMGVRILDPQMNISSLINDDQDLFVEIDFWCRKDGLYLTPNIQLLDANGTWVLSTGNWNSVTLNNDPYSEKEYKKGFYRSRLRLPAFFLNEGTYNLNALVNRDVSTTEAYAADAISFTIVDTGAMKKEYTDQLTGVVRPRLEWNTAQL